MLAAVAAELDGSDTPLPLPTLLTRIKQKMPLVPAQIISAEITTAAAAGLLHIVDAAVTLPPQTSSDPSTTTFPDSVDFVAVEHRPLRAVVVDVESVVRLDPDAPEYRDARIWQIGA